jgi:hypothetical protein
LLTPEGLSHFAGDIDGAGATIDAARFESEFFPMSLPGQKISQFNKTINNPVSKRSGKVEKEN